jgi:hypothetical protein
MSFEEKLFKHRDIFKANIKGGTILSHIDGYVGEQVIDYYGVPALFKIIDQVENPAEFVTLLFMDALVNSCAHFNGYNFERKINRDILVLNTDNCYDGWANITHRRPQIILGLKKEWSKEDLVVFNKLFKEYIMFYFNVLPAEVFICIKKDDDLDNMETQYSTLGISISKNVLAEFQKLRRGI